MNGKVLAMFICPKAGDPMQEVEKVRAVTGCGLEGDRYASGKGSFNQQKCGHRQVALINGIFFEDSGFEFIESRRNIVTIGVELMYLIGREFQIGAARFRGVKYCTTCERPNKLVWKTRSFKEAFFDRGGLIADVISSGVIKTGDSILPPT